MLASPVAEAARRRIARICHNGLDAPALLRELAAAVSQVVGYDGAVWATTDPVTLLITGAHVEELPRESAPAFYENEYLHDDVNKFSRLARGLRPVATMSEATGGVLSRSRVHRELGSVFGFQATTCGPPSSPADPAGEPPRWSAGIPPPTSPRPT